MAVSNEAANAVLRVAEGTLATPQWIARRAKLPLATVVEVLREFERRGWAMDGDKAHLPGLQPHESRGQWIIL